MNTAIKLNDLVETETDLSSPPPITGAAVTVTCTVYLDPALSAYELSVKERGSAEVD